MKYKGNGFLQGVPARDLTDDEVKLYGFKRLLDSGLYEEERKKKSKRLETAPAAVEDIENGTRN